MTDHTPTFDSSSKKEEQANSITHGIGIIVALVAIGMLIHRGIHSDGWLYLIAVLVYGLSFFWTYLSSTLYHSFHQAGVQFRNKLHLMDHTAIYLFIAGTYTPISLFVLEGAWSIGILIAVWSIALLGIFFKVFFLGRFKKLSLILYLMMGWLIIVAAKPMMDHATTELLLWIGAGGLCYSIGTVFFSLRRMTYSHAVWHLFVLAGSICHFVGIYAHLPVPGIS